MRPTSEIKSAENVVELGDVTKIKLPSDQEFVRITIYSARSEVLMPKLKELGFGQLRVRIAELKQQGEDPTPAQIQLHQKVALSFACIGFTLIGIPLAIRTHRRETNIGIAMALVLVTAYYGLIVLGQALEGHPSLLPHLWMWMPNFLFQGIGCVLLWKTNRGI